MGNKPSTPTPDEDDGVRPPPVTEIEEAPSPPEPPFVPPEVAENDSDEPFSDDTFNLGLESKYGEIKEDIMTKSEEEGKQYIYRDGEYPAEASSLYYSSQAGNAWRNVTWKRPHEISSKPRLLKDGVNAADVIQGSLGDCWFLSSCAALAQTSKYMKRLIPSGQTMEGDGYVGMFHFHFWRFGKWVDVIIDDELPTIYDKPAFARSSDNDEFWVPLMEKAYSKLHGSYEALQGGFAKDALEDLTGGLAVNFELGKNTPPDLYKKILRAYRNNSFICAGIEGTSEATDERTGLVSRHAYTVTAAMKVKYQGATVNLMKIRNPWGNKVEWKGEWSDGSYTWDSVDDDTKAKLGYEDKDNGEWWMSFPDFKYYFSDVTICTVGPDFDEDGVVTGDKWYLKSIEGKWVRGISAGGCRNDADMYATNPQYYVYLSEPDDFDPINDDPEEEGKCSVIMGLMQEYRRAGKSKGLENLYLGLTAYKVKERPQRKLDADYLRYTREYANSGKYVNTREVSITAEFEPGHYIILPASFYPNKPGSFLIRIFTEKPIHVEEIY